MTESPQIHILMVGGGSGGHFFPLMSIAEAIAASGERPRLYFAGPDPYDKDALTAHGIEYVWIPAGKTRRYRSLLNVFDIFKTALGLLIALLKLFFIYPDAVVSKGGYTSVPVVIAAWFFRIPILVHESDSLLGRANRIGIRLARKVIVSYAETEEIVRGHGKEVFRFGIPVRRALLAPSSNSLDIDKSRKVIFVIGGSQGAERINALILDSLDELLSTYTIIHQTGTAHFDVCLASAERLITNEEHKQYYRPAAFLDATMLNDAYHAADIVVSRAGSTSMYEIALHGKPSIIIPIPEDVSHDQRSNAYAYARTGAASVLEEKNLTDSLLRAEIDRIMQDEKIYADMAKAASAFPVPDSADRIAALLLTVAKEH